MYWVNNPRDADDQLWFADLSTGEAQLVIESSGGIQLRGSSPIVGDEAKVYFHGGSGCATGCTWSPTAGLYSIPMDTPNFCPVAAWPDETALILQCYDPFTFAHTDRLRYDLVTGELTYVALPGEDPLLNGLRLRSKSPNGRYELYTSDIMVVPVANVKDTTTGTVTAVAVTGHAQSVMLLPTWWIFGPQSFINWFAVTDDGKVVYDKAVYHNSLRSWQIRSYDTVTGTDSILPGYDALHLWIWGEGPWMVDYDYWNEIGRNAAGEGRQPDTYLELSNKNDPSQRYGLPAGAQVKAMFPDGRILVTSLTPLNPGDPPGLGIYFHDGPG